MIDIPPGKYFISHSYKDSVEREHMLTLLPDDVETFIFPSTKTSPLEFVSNLLIGAILACDGMIYLDEGVSATSFWVAFERDYALRSGKTVYRYLPSKKELSKYTLPPLDLAIFASYLHREMSLISPILDFMKKRRYFDISIDKEIVSTSGRWVNQIELGIQDTISRGGYVVVFWSGDKTQKTLMYEIGEGLKQRRVIVACLINCFDMNLDLISEVIPDLMKTTNLGKDFKNYYVNLMDENGLQNKFIDNLIVRLYWLIFRNQFPELVYE